MKNISKVKGKPNLYLHVNGTYYHRTTAGGKNTYTSLATQRQDQALKNQKALELRGFAAEQGLEVDEPSEPVTVVDVIKRYEQDGYPDRRGRRRADKLKDHDYRELPYCETLKEGFKGKLVNDLSPKALDAYHEWRVATVSAGAQSSLPRQGHRVTDLELNTLNSALKWAMRKELIKSNPIASRTRYHSSKDARHAREVAPASIDEVHHIASILFSTSRSEVLGWQILFEAQTGLRCDEVISLRTDARSDEAGGISADGKTICIHRAKEQGIVCNFLEIHAGLALTIKAHAAWKAARYPNSPFHLPGLRYSDTQPVGISSLSHALLNLFKEGTLKKHFTSHGMRSFYVWARRSQGAGDPRIAYELNQIGGVKTLEQVYGSIPAHWEEGGVVPWSWLPTGKFAWDVLNEKQKRLDPGSERSTRPKGDAVFERESATM
jgi:hypothetical protein